MGLHISADNSLPPQDEPKIKVLIHDKRDRPSTFFHKYVDVGINENVFIGLSVKKLLRVQNCSKQFPAEFNSTAVRWEDPWWVYHITISGIVKSETFSLSEKPQTNNHFAQVIKSRIHAAKMLAGLHAKTKSWEYILSSTS